MLKILILFKGILKMEYSIHFEESSVDLFESFGEKSVNQSNDKRHCR